MPDLVKFSDLKDSQPLTLNGDDLVAVAHKEQSSTTGYSTMTTTPTQLSQYAIEEQTFVNLKTSSKTVETSINQTISNLADDYDNTATYEVDDCVLYEGNLYKCITAIPVAEEWDSTHWEQIKAVDVGSGGGGELPTYEKSASGSVVSFTDGGDNIPVKSLVAEIVASQAGSGTPSPSNVRAISGWDSINISQFAVNLFNSSLEFGNIDNTGSDSGTSARYIRSVGYTPVIPNTSYYFYSSTSQQFMQFYVIEYSASKSFIQRTGIMTGSTLYSERGIAYTVSSNTKYIRVFIYKSEDFTTTSGVNISINYPSTDTTYHAYKGTTYTISLGSTVYGGTLDVTKGVLTVTHQMDIFDGDVSENWSLASDGTVNRRFVLYGISSIKEGTYNQSKTNYLSWATGTSHDSGTFTLGESTTYGFYIVVHDKSSNFADLATFKTYLSNNNLQLLTEMPTPVVIQLTPTEVRTLLRENNIYANSGDVEIEYFTEDAKPIADLVEAMESNEQKHTYSTTEHIVGTWIDGSAVYEKVVDLGSDTQISYDTWTLTNVSLASINRLIFISCLNSEGTAFYGDLLGGNNNGYLQLQTPRNGTYVSIRYLIFRYTKSSS